MRFLTAFVSTSTLVLFTAPGARAQETPDLSGTWTFDSASVPTGGRGGLNPPRQLTLTQDADTFSLSWAEDGGATTMTYNLDGSESRNEDGVSRANWQDDRLVIVTVQSFGGREMEQRRVLWMDGDDLVLEVPGSVPLQGGGAPAVVRLVFTKSPPHEG